MVGAHIGDLCRESDRGTTDVNHNPTDCHLITSNNQPVPSHLAVQLRFSDNTLPNPIFTEVIGFISNPACLYNDWIAANGQPQHQPPSPNPNQDYRGCPQ